MTIDSVFNIDNISFQIANNKEVFGDGSHETTQLILQALSELDLTNKKIIDIGIGNGVLSIYAYLKSAKEILGIECDDKAIELAKQNCKKNNVNIEILKNHLLYNIKYAADIIIANLPLGEQIELFREIQNNLCPKGLIIISWPNPLDLNIYLDLKNFNTIKSYYGKDYDIYVLELK